MLTPADIALLPTDEDIAFYRLHGWWISPRIFSDDEIAAAVRGADRFYAGERDTALPDGRRHFGWSAEHGDVLRKNDYSTLQMRELGAFIRKPLLGAIAARLAGTPSIRLWHDQLLWKPIDTEEAGRKANVGWHTDRGYWKTCTSDDMLTAWIPFHDVDDSHGTLAVMDGSHRWGEHHGELNFFDPDLAKQEGAFDRLRGKLPRKRVPMVLRKGQASFHHVKLVHGSGPNRSRQPRRSLAVHLQDEANRWRAHRLPSGELAGHENVHFCRKIDGVADFTDPAVCPTLWDARWLQGVDAGRQHLEARG
ncbi:MAG TPA: phytanoyl-CoA dioxygenase family protein [Planctomycetota bacterium]|nr:phytanoyl-CoA dioxygenase family protein [Planctomycetota bacterium]